MEYLFHYLVWTFFIYWLHRIVHITEWTNYYHSDHHRYITENWNDGLENITGWSWSDVFLIEDTWKSTVDLWLTEVIPTILYSSITGQWWILIMYWLWSSLLAEVIEHNPKFNVPFIAAGKWHLTPMIGFGNTMMMVKRFTRQIKDTIEKHCIQKIIIMELIFGRIGND